MTSPPTTAAVESWAFKVDSPFRGAAEIRELAATSDRLAGTAAGADWAEMEDVFGEDLALAEDEFEAYDEFEPRREDEAYDEAELDEADLLEEATANDHPLAAVFSLPRLAFDAMAKGGWATAIAIAVGAGLRDVNRLTNMVFWFRHPELTGQKIRPDQRDLAQEWLHIRDHVVRPALAGSAPTLPPPMAPPTPTPSAAGQRTSIPADGLRWFGPPSEQTPELLAFMRKVYDLHVKRSRGNFVDTLPESALLEVESGKKARKDAAAKAREMLAAARAAIAAEGLTGTVRIGVLSAYRSADHQFDIWQGKTTQGQGGFPHYYQVTKETRRRPQYGGEHSDKAAAYLAGYMGQYVAAPGYSNHQDGLSLDLGTRKGKGRLIKLYEGSWFHNWMKVNAARTYHFEPLEGEAWHWTYRPKAAGASEAEAWSAEVTPTAVTAGRIEVPRIPLLASHRGNAPDLILRWNGVPAVPKEIDVVVHLHGYSWANMTLPKHMEVWAGLDLTPVDGASGSGRSQPTLTVLPRGHFTGVKVGRIYRYTFPALTTNNGLTTLISVALKEFADRVGGLPPKVGRLILTAHSGGGAPLMQILRRHDPHEVHVFDGLYQDASALADWAARHIKADRLAVQSGTEPTGAMRVFFGPSTKGYSLRLDAALAGHLRDAPSSVKNRYRVESSKLGHWQIARQYGWRVLADPAVEVPDAVRPSLRRTPTKPALEVDSAEVPFAPEAPFLPEAEDAAEAEFAEAWELGEPDTEGEDELEGIGSVAAFGVPEDFGGVDGTENEGIPEAGEDDAPGMLEGEDEWTTTAGQLESGELGAEFFGPIDEALTESQWEVQQADPFPGDALEHFGTPMALPPQGPKAEGCRTSWFRKLASLPASVRDVLETPARLSRTDALERVQRAIDLGVRDVNLLTNFAFFAEFAHERGYCPIPRGHYLADDWLFIQKEVQSRLSRSAPPTPQPGPVPCVGQRENRLADPQTEVAPTGLTGRYEYTLTGHSVPSGALAINQAGRHLEVSLAPFSLPPGLPGGRPLRFYRCDLDESGAFLAVNRERADRRFVLRTKGSVLSLENADGGPAFATARRVETRPTIFPEALISVGESIDDNPLPRGPIKKLVQAARRIVTTLHVTPFLLQREHLPLARHQVDFLRERFNASEWTNLLRKAVAATGHRAAEAAEREGLRADLEAYVNRVINDRRHGIDRSDYGLARAVVRQTLSEAGFADQNRRQSTMDWLQMLSELTDQPIAADSVIGARPTRRPVGTYVYDISIDVAEAAFFLGGGVGKMIVRQVRPTAWSKAIELRVWFASVGVSVKLGTDSFSGRATSALPWTERDFIGRVERVKGGVEVSLPGVSAGPSAGFLTVYGSEALPPLTVLDAGVDVSASIEVEPGPGSGPRRWKVKGGIGVSPGVHGLMGWTKPMGRLAVQDVTTIPSTTLYGVGGGGQRALHFCFDSALLTPAARQSLRVAAALWRPFLADSHSTMSIIGYADKAGSDAYNQTLSERRALNTRRALQDILGPGLAARVSTQGRGEKEAKSGGVRPGAPDRRVEVRLNGLTILTLNGG